MYNFLRGDHLSAKHKSSSKKRSVPKYQQQIRELQESVFELQKIIGELAITIYVSTEYPPNGDIGRWANKIIDEPVKSYIKDAKFVDGKICVKVIKDVNTIEWEEVELWDEK